MLATPLLLCRLFFVFLRDVWILTQRAAIASRRAINLAMLSPCGICGILLCVGHSFAYVAHLCIFERCLDSNPVLCRMTWLGHASVLAEVDGHTFLTDPIFSLRASALQQIGKSSWFFDQNLSPSICIPFFRLTG